MTDLPPSFPPAIPPQNPRKPSGTGRPSSVGRPNPASGHTSSGKSPSHSSSTGRRKPPVTADSAGASTQRPRETPPPSFAPQSRAQAQRRAQSQSRMQGQHRPQSPQSHAQRATTPENRRSSHSPQPEISREELSARQAAARTARLREQVGGNVASQPPSSPTHPPVIPPRRSITPSGNAPATSSPRPHSAGLRPAPGQAGSGRRAGTMRPPTPGAPTSQPTAKPRRKQSFSPLKITLISLLVLPVVLSLIAGLWVYSLWSLADDSLKHTQALSGAPNTAGTTYLIAGSDSRDNVDFKDDTEGKRTDTIMLLHRADNGQVSLISIPRDSFVKIPGQGEGKINSAYAYGGPALLVQTVEELTGITVDHYVEVGMDGVMNTVDAVEGVELCLDYDVADEFSQLNWEAGCHKVDGKTALAFARMRYADPEGDIGRAKRQREVVSAVSQKIFSRETYTSPTRIKRIVSAGASSLTTDPETKSWEIAYLAKYFQDAHKSGFTGTPPIANIDYQTYAGSSVLLDPQKVDEFFRKVASGTLTKEDFVQAP
ncbi:LCP family protein [Gleimia sp. 6138-11-ORH1]|uniref:LCP family protein n=1 Tax=Gleimia sp. 6138-11-ORH1 TaxID=2973937 RepID=UPI002169A048|nr:LCP family protein [Gleimia sp. 6138-11-ORH1]MCS4484020.1 LCP family protein [Gleimia sp. 6138-11-ORH1]